MDKVRPFCALPATALLGPRMSEGWAGSAGAGVLARSLSARVWFLVTLRALLFMSATPPPVQSYHQGASHRKSRSPSIPRLRNNSKRSMLCLTTVVLLGWVVVAIKDDAVVSSLLDRFFYTTSRYSTLGLPAYMLEPVNGHGPWD